jgi:hypothetical protein
MRGNHRYCNEEVEKCFSYWNMQRGMFMFREPDRFALKRAVTL